MVSCCILISSYLGLGYFGSANAKTSVMQGVRPVVSGPVLQQKLSSCQHSQIFKMKVKKSAWNYYF